MSEPKRWSIGHGLDEGPLPGSEKSSEKGLGEKLGETEKRILAMLTKNRFATIPNMAQALEISTTAIEKNLKKLNQRGRLRRIGPAKGGYWEVINDQ